MTIPVPLQESDLIAVGFDKCILGVLTTTAGVRRVAYSVPEIIEQLVGEGCAEEYAYEHFEFNIRGAYVGPQTPVYVDEEMP